MAHGVDGALEIGSDAVHLVYEADTGHVILIGLTPDRLGLGLDAGNGVENNDATIEDAETSFHLSGEVHVSRCIYDVNLIVLPEGSGGSGGDGNAALAFLWHPVHDGGAEVYLSNLVGTAGNEEHTLGDRGLTGVNVSDESDISDPFYREGLRHGVRLTA